MSGDRKGALAAAVFSTALALPFLGSAYHLDEPFFLAIARQILANPLEPVAFFYNWYGHRVPMAEINAYPSPLPYLEAVAWSLTGGREWAMRLAFLPFDALAAVALYLLAARFLRRPLLPTLITLASPIYFVSTRSLMVEKWIAAFGFWGFWTLTEAARRKRLPLYWLSAFLLSVAVAFKYTAVVLVPPAVFFAWRAGGLKPKHLAAYLAFALLPAGCYLWVTHALGHWSTAVLFERSTNPAPWSPRSIHAARSLLAFIGLGGVATAFWGMIALHSMARVLLGVLALLTAILFIPTLDWEPVALSDRLVGFGSALGAAALFLRAAREGRSLPGWSLWGPWAGCVLLACFAAFPFIAARYVAFALPPLVFGMAEILENRLSPERWRRLALAALAVTTAAGLGVAHVDARYANAQRNLARLVAEKYEGRRVWFTGHWGLQHYLEDAGARALELSEGWGEVERGDIVVVPRINTMVCRPGGPVLAHTQIVPVPELLPLRHMPLGPAQAGFYTNAGGFLPFTFATYPLDEFSLVERL